MKHLIAALFISAALVVSAADEAAIAPTNDTAVSVNETIVTANATLKDGSTVKGQFLAPQITGSTVFSNQLALDPAIVKTLTFTGTNGEAKVSLINGDAFAINISNTGFKIKSLLGDLEIPRANFRALSFSVCRGGNAAEGGLVFYCTFDDEAAITSPAVGPSGVFQGGSFTSGKNGKALFVPAFTSCAKFEIPSGVIGTAGTIEYWGKVNELDSLTEGGCPRFFEIIKIGKGEISQDWNSNNGGGGYGLTFRMDGLPWMATSSFQFSSAMRSSYHRPPLRPEPGWHHYALVWDINGVNVPGPGKPSAAVFLDGKLILFTPFVPTWKGPVNVADGSTLLFPSREDEMPDYARRAYTIDEFKIWNYAKTSFDL